jgi:hypothetical protein
MGAAELNEGLARAGVQPGEVRNPLGISNLPVRKRNAEIRGALFGEMSKQCDIPGAEHLTQFQYGIRTIVYLFMAGDRWAVKFCADRMFGRVPLSIEMDVTHREEFAELTDSELLARLDAIRAQLVAESPRSEALDAVVVEQGE